MNRYFISLAYNGSTYHGWQKQPNATSVQEVLEKALRIYFRREVETLGCGRTDTGVHATAFYAHFDLDQPLNLDNETGIVFSINSLLPFSIAVKNIIAVHEDAHARFDATWRSYEYHIHSQKDPFKVNRSLWLREHLDIATMNEVAQILLEHTDFSCFSKSNTQTFTNNCDVKTAYFEEIPNGLVFHITANRFLRNMVRAIVGTLLEVGRGKLNADDFRQILARKNRSEAGQSVAACGLYLTKITYPYLTQF